MTLATLILLTATISLGWFVRSLAEHLLGRP